MLKSPIGLVDTIWDSAGIENRSGLSHAFEHIRGKMANGMHFLIKISEELTQEGNAK